MNFHAANKGYHMGCVVRSSLVVLHLYGLIGLAALRTERWLSSRHAV